MSSARLPELRNGLRCGDLWGEGSHQYRQGEDYLLPPACLQRTPSGENAPRERALGDRKRDSMEAPTRYPDLGLLMGGSITTKHITDNWDELLPLTASLRLGTVTASL